MNTFMRFQVKARGCYMLSENQDEDYENIKIRGKSLLVVLAGFCSFKSNPRRRGYLHPIVCKTGAQWGPRRLRSMMSILGIYKDAQPGAAVLHVSRGYRAPSPALRD